MADYDIVVLGGGEVSLVNPPQLGRPHARREAPAQPLADLEPGGAGRAVNEDADAHARGSSATRSSAAPST